VNVNTAPEIYCELYEVNVIYSKYLVPYSLFITTSFDMGLSQSSGKYHSSKLKITNEMLVPYF